MVLLLPIPQATVAFIVVGFVGLVPLVLQKRLPVAVLAAGLVLLGMVREAVVWHSGGVQVWYVQQ
jgi:hypothetical protein